MASRSPTGIMRVRCAVQFLVAGLKRDSDGTASYYLLILSELITSMTVRPLC